MRNPLSRCFVGMLVTAVFCFPVTALAAAPTADYGRAPIDSFDLESIQRGARIFVNYCLSCHSARYMRYGRMVEDLSISKKILQQNLMFSEGNLASRMETSLDPADGAAWFGQAPPDLTLVSRVRGVDWLYHYLLGFYRDEASLSGWNNTVFPNVSMPHAMSDLQGVYVKDADSGQLRQIEAGVLPPSEFNATVADLVNFLSYIGEPSKNKRLTVGYAVLAYLMALLMVTYYWYKRQWKDVS